MIDILIESTATTPYVKIDSESSTILIEGKSSPANALGFYHPLINKIKLLFANSTAPIEVTMSFRYFNTSSSKCLFDLFKMLKGLERLGHTIVVNWHYEEDDEDMLETGEDYADILDFEFNYVEVEEIGSSYLMQAV